MIFKFKFQVRLKAEIKKLRAQGTVSTEFNKGDISKSAEGDDISKTEDIKSSVPARGYLSRLKSWCRTLNVLLSSLLTHLISVSAQLDRLSKQFATVVTIIVLMVDITGGSLLGSSPEETMQWLNSLTDKSQ